MNSVVIGFVIVITVSLNLGGSVIVGPPGIVIVVVGKIAGKDGVGIGNDGIEKLGIGNDGTGKLGTANDGLANDGTARSSLLWWYEAQLWCFFVSWDGTGIGACVGMDGAAWDGAAGWETGLATTAAAKRERAVMKCMVS